MPIRYKIIRKKEHPPPLQADGTEPLGTTRVDKALPQKQSDDTFPCCRNTLKLNKNEKHTPLKMRPVFS